MSKRREFISAVLTECERVDPTCGEPVAKPPMVKFKGQDYTGWREFRDTLVDVQFLKDTFARVYGRPGSLRDCEQVMKGINGWMAAPPGKHPVCSEGLRFYLTTGRDPYQHWSASIDRNGIDINAEWRKKQEV